MCGLFGIVNGKTSRNANSGICKMVADGIAVNSLRGTDSVGLFQQDKKGPYIHKRLGNGFDFIQDSKTHNYIRDADTAYFTVIHNRAATEGAVSVKNSHPFEHMHSENLNWTIGVHNGTLTDWKAKDSEFLVDSDWAISRINELGIEAFKEFSGAFTFIWWDDKNPDVLHFARNYQRPMYISYTKWGQRMLFASEHEMLNWIAERNKIELEDQIIELSPGFVYSFDINEPKKFTKERFPTPVAKVVDYSAERRKEFIGKVLGVLSRKPVTTSVETALSLVPKDETVGAASVLAANRGKVSAITCTPDETRLAKVAEMHDQRVSFTLEHYDNTSSELWGTVVHDEMLYSAVIRQVNKATYDTWKCASALSCRVVGATAVPGEDGGQDLSLVLSRTVSIVSNADSSTEDSEFERACKESIEAHIAGKEKAEVTSNALVPNL